MEGFTELMSKMERRFGRIVYLEWDIRKEVCPLLSTTRILIVQRFQDISKL